MRALLLNEKFEKEGDPIKQLKIKWTPQQYIKNLIKEQKLKNVSEDDFFSDLGQMIYDYMDTGDLIQALIDTIDETPVDYQKGFYDSWFETWADQHKDEDDYEEDDDNEDE